MERFKACEKELKTKAFSKEGLNAAAKIDPKEQEKEELCSWVNDTVEALSLQVEKFEAEQESLQVAMKKSKKHDTSKNSRLSQVGVQIERHKFHLMKLEIILRMLENGNLSFEEVNTLFCKSFRFMAFKMMLIFMLNQIKILISLRMRVFMMN